MESYGSGTFQTRRWRFGMKWMAKHASSLQLTFAKMGSMPSSAPTMADAFSMTRRYPAELTCLLKHGFIMSSLSFFFFCHDGIHSSFNQVYFSVCTFISVWNTTLKFMWGPPEAGTRLDAKSPVLNLYLERIRYLISTTNTFTVSLISL